MTKTIQALGSPHPVHLGLVLIGWLQEQGQVSREGSPPSCPSSWLGGLSWAFRKPQHLEPPGGKSLPLKPMAVLGAALPSLEVPHLSPGTCLPWCQASSRGLRAQLTAEVLRVARLGTGCPAPSELRATGSKSRAWLRVLVDLGPLSTPDPSRPRTAHVVWRPSP